MLNNKFIKIIIAVVIILVCIFAYLIIKGRSSTTDTKNTSTLGSGDRLPFNTNTSGTGTVSVVDQYNTSTTNTSTSSNINPITGTNSNTNTNTTNLNSRDYSSNNPEDILKKKIEKLLFNWNITRDEGTLREAVTLSEGVDNEIVLEAWLPFMKINSNELIKLINTSPDKQKIKTTLKIIFQWYIELSGEYEKLSTSQKQQITNQYNQLK